MNQEEWRKPQQGWVRIKTSSSVENIDKISAMDEIVRITNVWAVISNGSFFAVTADLEAIRCAHTCTATKLEED